MWITCTLVNILDCTIFYTIVRTVPICITEKKNELSFGWFSSDDFIILISDEIISMHDMVDFYTTVCETNQKKKKNRAI